MFFSKLQSTHFWFAFLYPPVLLFEQMELCWILLRSLFQGYGGQLLSGLRRCLPLGASTGNKADLTWWTTSIGTHFLVLWGGTVLCRTYALFFSFFSLVKLLYYVLSLAYTVESQCFRYKLAKTCFEWGPSVALETDPFSIWPEKHAYFSLLHNIYQNRAAKSAVLTFLYNSALDWFQWAGHSIISVFRPLQLSPFSAVLYVVTDICCQCVPKRACDPAWMEMCEEHH